MDNINALGQTGVVLFGVVISMIQTHLFVSENGVYPLNGQFCREQWWSVSVDLGLHYLHTNLFNVLYRLTIDQELEDDVNQRVF